MIEIYKEYCVAFIDILGFKEMTNSIDKIRSYGKLCEGSIQIMKEFNPEKIPKLQ